MGKTGVVGIVKNGTSPRALGLRVLITDHHLPGAQLPAADAIVNPNQPGCDFPSKNLAGVGVMLYTLMGIRHVLRQRGWAAAEQAKTQLQGQVSGDALRDFTRWVLQFLGVADFFATVERAPLRFGSQPVNFRP